MSVLRSNGLRWLVLAAAMLYGGIADCDQAGARTGPASPSASAAVALVKLEADYILQCQYRAAGARATGAINNVYGPPTWVVPRENALAILGLAKAATTLGVSTYLARAQEAMNYLLRVQPADGGWFDQYNYAQPVGLSKSTTQTAEVMIAMNKLGYLPSRYAAMVKAADFLIRMQNPINKGGRDDGLVGGGIDAFGKYRTWRWTSDNAFAYQAFKAAVRWARLQGDSTRQALYTNRAARILTGINTVLKDKTSAVWYGAVTALGAPIVAPHEWMSYAPEMLDVPTAQARNPNIGVWIYNHLVDPATGAAVWDDGPHHNRLSPGLSFQASLVWMDLGQLAYRDAAWTWALNSGLHQTIPDANGVSGGWIDWKETNGAQAPFWQRFIDTSFYSIAVATGGYNFNPE